MAKFIAGKSGNPKGRPKREWTWSNLLREALEQTADNGQPIKQVILDALLQKCKKGDSHAINLLMNRMDGMPKQEIGFDPQEVKHLVKIDIHEPGTR